jgi:putative FmdB family regulatory protein
MPRYRYHCNTCDMNFAATHLWEEPQNECVICGKHDIKKLITKPLKTISSKDKPPRTGNLVKKSIEENKEILEELKKEANNESDHE